MTTRKSSSRTPRTAVSACAVVLACATPAFAHESGGTGGFTSGLSHPVSGLDHVLAMIAVGLWGAQLGQPMLWLLPVAFPIMMAMGGFMGLIGVPLPGVEIGIAASAIVLGAMVLTNSRVPAWLALVLVGGFAVFHGHAHGTELPEGQSVALYSIGFVISTGLLHAVGIGFGSLHHVKRGAVFVRAGGALVALGGLWFLWKAIAP